MSSGFICGLPVREYMRRYRQKPEVKEKMREYYQKPEVKEKMREYYQKPEVKEKMREYVKPSTAVNDFFSHFRKFHSVEELEQTANNYVKATCRLEGRCDILNRIKTDARFERRKLSV